MKKWALGLAEMHKGVLVFKLLAFLGERLVGLEQDHDPEIGGEGSILL